MPRTHAAGSDIVSVMVEPDGFVPKDCILRMPSVRERCGLSAATIYRRMAAGDFPRAVSLGGKAVGWRESAIDAWIAARREGV